MAKKQRSESNKNYFNSYESKAAKNRQARLERHQKNHPNDTQGGSTSYRRKSPLSESGWLTASMDSELTPSQVAPITVKNKEGKRETIIPEAAKPLKEMTKAERKRFAQVYSRIRKLHKHETAYGKGKKSKGGKDKK